MSYLFQQILRKCECTVFDTDLFSQLFISIKPVKLITFGHFAQYQSLQSFGVITFSLRSLNETYNFTGVNEITHAFFLSM